MKELRLIIKRFKRRDAPEPDEVPIEVCKELNKEGLGQLLGLLSILWKEEEELPTDVCKARIALTFEKGTSNQHTTDIYHYRTAFTTYLQQE